jgi:hypothetical protein
MMYFPAGGEGEGMGLFISVETLNVTFFVKNGTAFYL